jgi:hypothetical protein
MMGYDAAPSGIRGWLILPAIGLVISPILQAVELFRTVLPAFDADTWRTLTEPDSPYSAAAVMFECVALVLLFIYTLWLGYLFFFRKSARVPALYVTWLALWIIYNFIDLILARTIPIPPDQSDHSGSLALGRSITNGVIWSWYFLQSKRVKNTFVEPTSPANL